MNQRAQGAKFEALAVSYLQEKHYLILEQNFHAGKIGEIDIIAQIQGTVVFVEVKYRSSKSVGYASEAVTFKKQQTICRVADVYLKRNHYGPNTSCRFDVIAIEDGHLEHMENAFEYIPIRGF